MAAILLMAGLALGLCMLAFQRKVSELMIETVRVELNDIGIGALMFGVAKATFAVCDTRFLAVKTAFLCDICGDFFVAVQA